MEFLSVVESAAAWVMHAGENLGWEVLHLVGLGAAFFLAERLRPAHAEQGFFKRDFFVEAGYPMFNTVFGAPVIGVLLAWSITPIVQTLPVHHVLQPVADVLPLIAQIFLALLVIDIAVYVEHRYIAHGPLWEFHALHHMTPEVSWLTWARVHPVNGLTIAMTATTLHYVLGFEGAAAAAAGTIAGSISIWEHSNTSFAWPRRLQWLFVSPRFHRWHHSSDAEAIDKNFCLIFPFLDLLMGTYYCPDRLPSAYGVHRGAADEPEIPGRLAAQLWYPFPATFAAFGRRLSREPIRKDGDVLS
jgi:sterol desaturase/sphingolipid hydroxylase (fatty acid hydroxylase superfamily)